MIKVLFSIAGCSGALAVILGAFGAHVLKSHLAANALETYQTAVFYHFVHTLALLIVILFYQQKPESHLLLFSACSFLIGLLLFSGSLYCLAMGAPRWLGPVTPIGGLTLICAWLTMAVAALRLH